MSLFYLFFFFQAEDGIRYFHVTGVQTCALPISPRRRLAPPLARRTVALAQETGGETELRARVARRCGRRADRRGPHPSKRRCGTARVRDRDGRRTRRDRLDRARPRPAATASPRRGARPARLR